MKTPIQELKEQLVEEDIRGLSIDYYLQKEKQFAFECFEAGENYYKGNHNAFSKKYPKFEEFYKQFEQ